MKGCSRTIPFHFVYRNDDGSLCAETVGCGCCAGEVNISDDELDEYIELLEDALQEARDVRIPD